MSEKTVFSQKVTFCHFLVLFFITHMFDLNVGKNNNEIYNKDIEIQCYFGIVQSIKGKN